MSLKPGLFGVLLIATGVAAASIATAPTTVAEPVWPVGGAEPADATISDLEAEGYTVQINWVDDIHNPNGTRPPNPDTLFIVWVDIGCPSNNFD